MAGFWSRLFGIDSYDAAQRVLPPPYEPFVSTGGIPVADPGTPLRYWINGNSDAEHMWRTQPNVRKVVGFAARNVASIPLHVHERLSDTERQRVVDHPLARLMSTPRPRVGSYRFWEAVIADGLLYDRWAVLKRIEADGALRLSRIPSWRLWLGADAFGEVYAAKMWDGEDWIDLDLDDLIFDHGYAPKTAGLSPVETLRDLLDESAEAVEYRRQVWANGARVPQWVYRPKEAGEWGEPARDRFAAGLRNYARDGGKAGSVPVFEDGMELRDGTKMQSKDMLDLEGRKLSAAEVAGAWFIAPELVGDREGTYSNIDAYRQMLYRDSLGPYITAWEQAINVGLTPDLADGRPLYVEANIDSKLRGSFLEQAKVMQSATGAPWMLRNEARALQNRPPVAGGDELVVPLNVLAGGQASPSDSGRQNEASGPVARKVAVAALKARVTDRQAEKVAEVLQAFFRRQGKSVLSAIGGGGDWWDAKRWDDELSDDLYRVAVTLSEALGKAEAEALGFEAGDYDLDVTLEFLRAASERHAKNINLTTKGQLDEAIVDDEADPADVFSKAEDSRAAGVGTGVAVFLAGFATREAAQQIARAYEMNATKTWVTGTNPRPAHAAMDGETVAIHEDFSNGLPWPGAANGTPDETAGCNCSLAITLSPKEGR